MPVTKRWAPSWCTWRGLGCVLGCAVMHLMSSLLRRNLTGSEGLQYVQGLDAHRLELPTCSIQPHLCARNTNLQKQQLDAAARMHHSIWKIGGSALAVCCTCCFLFGFLLQLQLWRREEPVEERPRVVKTASCCCAGDRWWSWCFVPFELTHPTISLKMWVFALLDCGSIATC